jgi:hypothetical protein
MSRSNVNLWLAMSQQAVDAYKAYPDSPMDERTHLVLSKMHDENVVRGLFPPVTVGSKTYRLFSLYFHASEAAKEAIDTMTELWPGHFIVIGAWWFDGRQVGTKMEDDVLVGDPVYPVHAQAYRFMRDKVTHDEDGNVTSTTPPTSNNDLEDVNLLLGQSPRTFEG